MKKINIMLTMIMILSYCFINNKNIKVSALQQYDFENITESEALEFVTNNNIDIPLGIVDSKVGEITKSIIQKCASNSNAVFFYNYGEMQKYADEIKEIVPSKNNNSRLIENTNTYYLQDNTVKNENGYWVTSG